jgi:hypothetical protein
MSSLLAIIAKVVNSWAVQETVGFLIIRQFFFLIHILDWISAERINARFKVGTFVSFDPAAAAVCFHQDTYIIWKKKMAVFNKTL